MSENSDPLQILPLILAAFPVAFALLWSAILYLTARLGGWQRLARVYPDHAIPERYAGFMSSGRMGWMNYNGVLKLHTDTRGLHLAVILPFRPGHAPICLPWHAIRISNSDGAWIKLTRVQVSHQGRPLGEFSIRTTSADRLELAARASG